MIRLGYWRGLTRGRLWSTFSNMRIISLKSPHLHQFAYPNRIDERPRTTKVGQIHLVSDQEEIAVRPREIKITLEQLSGIERCP